MVPGKATFRNLSGYSAYHEKTFSHGFGRAYDWMALNQGAIVEVISPDHEQALIIAEIMLIERRLALSTINHWGA